MFRIEGWDDQDFNLELFVCTDILKLNSLHYGYWQKEELPDINGATLSLADLKKAQELYTRARNHLEAAKVDERYTAAADQLIRIIDADLRNSSR